jgi:hypothetical protein
MKAIARSSASLELPPTNFIVPSTPGAFHKMLGKVRILARQRSPQRAISTP